MDIRATKKYQIIFYLQCSAEWKNGIRLHTLKFIILIQRGERPVRENWKSIGALYYNILSFFVDDSKLIKKKKMMHLKTWLSISHYLTVHVLLQFNSLMSYPKDAVMYFDGS